MIVQCNLCVFRESSKTNKNPSGEKDPVCTPTNMMCNLYMFKCPPVQPNIFMPCFIHNFDFTHGRCSYIVDRVILQAQSYQRPVRFHNIVLSIMFLYPIVPFIYLTIHCSMFSLFSISIPRVVGVASSRRYAYSSIVEVYMLN